MTENSILDNMDEIREIDAEDMLHTISGFPEQMEQALEIAWAAEIDTFFKVDDIIITGVGGSAISGSIIADVYRDKLPVPFIVNRDYDLPRWAHKDTCAIFVSYSGNTEETISAFKHACQKHCKIICISSGGKLKELAEHHGCAHIKVPGEFQPRAATSFLLFVLLGILKRMNILKESIMGDIDETHQIAVEAISHLNVNVPEVENKAKQLAQQIHTTMPQVYGFGIYSPVAIRWREQFNENAKIIARADILSECNHNDIVGWSGDPEHAKEFTVVLFRDRSHESANMTARLNFMRKAYRETAVQNLIEVTPRGKSHLARAVYLMLVGDFTSNYLAILRGIDPTPVDAINMLKEELGRL